MIDDRDPRSWATAPAPRPQRPGESEHEKKSAVTGEIGACCTHRSSTLTRLFVGQVSIVGDVNARTHPLSSYRGIALNMREEINHVAFTRARGSGRYFGKNAKAAPPGGDPLPEQMIRPSHYAPLSLCSLRYLSCGGARGGRRKSQAESTRYFSAGRRPRSAHCASRLAIGVASPPRKRETVIRPSCGSRRCRIVEPGSYKTQAVWKFGGEQKCSATCNAKPSSLVLFRRRERDKIDAL
ncbi:hypothetical protein EVAR_38311_1 [Eumeta japonica]|uniref:Uncharacterized protein n=1 Tax=Eumeta variegata TaxID=151549 RepID=A0A4C1W9J1_EUMVA|nr:hypothetical protein EVAR_38311_1 [Eumeta japonica]